MAKAYLSAFEERFVRAMIADPSSPSAAAATAGYAPSVAPTVCKMLMTRMDVTSAIEAGRATVHQVIAQQTGVQLSELVLLLRDLATFDIAELYDEDGNVKPIHEIPERTRLAIESMDTEEVFEGRGNDRHQTATVRKVRMAKRNEAIDKLMRHLGGYELDNRQHMEPLTQLLRELAGRGHNTLAISEE